MKIKLLTVLGIFLAMASCSGEDNAATQPIDIVFENKVLLLKVDYTTHAFEGGKELAFDSFSDTFTIDTDYVPPGDFGSITVKYQEMDATLFSGQIHWMGLGAIQYPEAFVLADGFQVVLTNDYVTPAGFENIFNPSGESYDYAPIWNAVQNLVKVRQYLLSNPQAHAKLFLYTPSVGVGNPEEWDWIIILKN